ncbi:MAG: TatD family hydrolase [Clostridia bacterium]|nr:TatD family hydrolase [Clostridia bacterium]
MDNIFETHAHYDDEAFDEDREKLLEELPKQGVCGIITAGADLKSSLAATQLAEKYPYIYAAVGVHPENIGESFDADYISKLERLLNSHKKIVAVGEIGLDYHFRDDNKRIQKEVFLNQVELANRHSLPVLVHDREAHGDTMEILRATRPRGIVHCFSGSVEMAKEVVKLGMYLGIGGVVTFKNAKTIVEVVQEMPLDVMVLETDAPYMAPVPLRGKRCDSSMIKYTAEKIAEIKNIDVQQVCDITKSNAVKLFGIE